jgi:TolB-like protein/tetratricopeptide (TPR) repeat protein
MSFLAELKRRNVIRVLIAYLAAAWFLIQIADTVVPAYGLPDSVVGILITILAIGLIPIVIVSWVFEWTPEGLRRDADVASGELSAPQIGKSLNRIIMVVLSLAVGFFAFDKFVLDPGRDAELAEQVRADTRVESFGDRSIAVLPFVNMSSDPEQVYFSDGVAEEILNLLAKIKELRVISRTSAFVHRGDVNIPDVAKALNVTYVLEGSVRRSGDQIRVTAQLIDARTDTHVWSDTWDRGAADIFAVQDEVARDVADELHVQLLNTRRPQQETEPETYSIYLQAKHLFYGEAGGVADKSKPIRLLRIVLERDPDFVPAMTLLSLVLWYEAYSDDVPDAERERLGREMAQLAITAYETDPDDAVAILYHGFYTTEGNDRRRNMSDIERALALEPNNTEVLRIAAMAANGIGRFDDAIILGERMIAINPLCIVCYPQLLDSYMFTRKYDKAEELQRRRISFVDDFGGYTNLAHVLVAAGRADEALEIYERMAEEHKAKGNFEGYEAEWLVTSAMALHDLGRIDEAAERIALLESKQDDYLAFRLTMYYAHVGANNMTLAWIRKGVDADAEFIGGFVWRPDIAILNDTPEWQQWRKDVGLDEEYLATIEFEIPDFGD